MAWLLGALLVLQLAAPLGCAVRPSAPADERLAALAQVVGHAVETCHHDDDGSVPAGNPGPCCPCALCHALTAACPAAPAVYVLARPTVVALVSASPQPPPSRRLPPLEATGPRGPPSLA